MRRVADFLGLASGRPIFFPIIPPRAPALDLRLAHRYTLPNGRRYALLDRGLGNSAGQAAVYLSQSAEHVHVLVRGSGLASTMSDYLVRRIQQSRKVTVHPYSEIKALDGDERMRSVTLAHQTTGASRDISVGNRFLMIGAEPTGWLKGSLAHDSKGFIQTGVNADGAALASIYQTSAPGILAIGDVRSRSIKRVAAAVGEGVAAIHAVQHFLNPPII